MDVLTVLFLGPTSENEDVINVGWHKFIKELPQDPVDILLEGTWGVSHAERGD